MGKNPENFETIHYETKIYEQKPINIDEFNDVEKTESRECIAKGKEKCRDVAEKNKLLKKRKNKSKKKKAKRTI